MYRVTHTEKNSVKGYLETQVYETYSLDPVTLQWKCISGTYGLGALPQGEYTIDKCYKLKEIKGKTEAYQGVAYPWVAKLTPQFETDRTGLLIHPDGNKKGTRGCIGICKTENDTEVYNIITQLLNRKKELSLLVTHDV